MFLFSRQPNFRYGTTRFIVGQGLSTQRKLYQPEGFSEGEQNMPAMLCTLLIRAGIEQNQGPVWICSVYHDYQD